MKEIDAQNYVKLDLLKLDTIELIDKTCKLAGIDRITPDNIDLEDARKEYMKAGLPWNTPASF